MKKNYIKLISIFGLCFLIISCKKNPNILDFGDYPVDYKIAYFENIGVRNVPSVKNLYGKNAQYADEMFEMPSYVTIESYDSSKDEFYVVMLLTVKNEEIDKETAVMKFNVRFKADNRTEKSYIRYVKAESLMSGQFLEVNSDGSEEQDQQAFDLFLRYMERFWK